MQLETFLDVLLIEEIPDDNAQGSGIVGLNGREILGKTESSVGRPSLGRVVSCDTRFPMMGMWVDMPYKAGDIVTTNEYGRNYEIALNKGKHGKDTKFYLIHYADVEGRVARNVPPGLCGASWFASSTGHKVYCDLLNGHEGCHAASDVREEVYAS